MVVSAEPVVVLLLGEEWRAAGAATAAMAGIGLGVALSRWPGRRSRVRAVHRC